MWGLSLLIFCWWWALAPQHHWTVTRHYQSGRFQAETLQRHVMHKFCLTFIMFILQGVPFCLNAQFSVRRHRWVRGRVRSSYRFGVEWLRSWFMSIMMSSASTFGFFSPCRRWLVDERSKEKLPVVYKYSTLPAVFGNDYVVWRQHKNDSLHDRGGCGRINRHFEPSRMIRTKKETKNSCYVTFRGFFEGSPMRTVCSSLQPRVDTWQELTSQDHLLIHSNKGVLCTAKKKGGGLF